ncbi:MAG TPA: phosphoribosylamine--glycine ligase [Bacillota bacterium]|nr:phosphoribosylamine--glycine ligase [Bacillota bacterium]
MKILVVGSGGREHAIIKKLRENNTVTEIYALPGNGGIAADAICVPIGAKDIESIKAFALEKSVDFAVIAPDDPLVMGCVDVLEAAGVPCFGPTANAAIIEGSKVFSKDLMKKYSIPTARCEVFSDSKLAAEYIKKHNKYPTVIKADGLALGKGVIIAENEEEAVNAVKSMIDGGKFGTSGTHVVIEEFMTGPEVSVLAFTDGKTVVPMVSSMDHKRAHDNDTGLNTGGMGTVAPNPYYTKQIADKCMTTIFLPTVNAMNSEGRSFKGCLYFGLMLTPEGPKVVEYNCRFGDPETQVVLPLMKTDLLTVMQAVHDGTLGELDVKFETGCCVCVIVASGGYPEDYKKGYAITLPEMSDPDVTLFHAGTKLDNKTLVTSGGRVLGVSAKAPSLSKAIDKSYEYARKVAFKDSFYRNDIGKRAMEADSTNNQ